MVRYLDPKPFFKLLVNSRRFGVAEIAQRMAGGAKKVIVVARVGIVTHCAVPNIYAYRLTALAKHTEVAVYRCKAYLRVFTPQFGMQPLGAGMAGNSAQKLKHRITLF